jgi:hypothetical protein
MEQTTISHNNGHRQTINTNPTRANAPIIFIANVVINKIV